MLKPFRTLRGCTLAASDGDIGQVREFYFDDEHWNVRYLVVNTGSWLLEREVLIAPQALSEVDQQGNTIAVNLTREQVRESPLAETDKPISRQHEAELYRHYGWQPYWMMAAGPGGMMLPPPELAPPPTVAPPPVVTEDPAGSKGDPHLRSSAELMSGYTIHAQDGEIGRVKDFIVDDESWQVRYLVIHTGVWFLGKDALLSPRWIEKVSCGAAEVFVNLPRSLIKDAPAYDDSAPISRAFEQRLHDHFGRKGYWDAVAGAGKA
jgi:uncharacterized protein YrrD